MNRQDKAHVVESLRNDFKSSEALFLVDVHGMSVSELYTLRKNLRQHKGTVKCAKNTLVKIAGKDIAGMSGLDPYLKNQVALVIAHDGAPAVAKVVAEMAKDHERMKVIAGFFESRVILNDMIQFLATLPPRPVLLAQVCGGLRAPLSRHVGVLNQVLARFLGTLTQIADKKQQV